MSVAKPTEIVIALDHPKNSEVYFFPANDMFRSRFLPTRSGGRMPPALTSYGISGIPGQRIHLDVKARTGRITDGLGDPQNKEFVDGLRKQCAANSPRPIFVGEPHEDKVYENLSPEDVQTWLYWMRRLVNDQVHDAEHRRPLGTYATLVQGVLPELETIVATGKVRRPIYDHTYIASMKEDASMFYKAPKAEPELVGAGK